MAQQLAIPVEVRPEEIERKQSFGAAIELCGELAGFHKDKQTTAPVGLDAGQFSRIKNGQEGIKWERLEQLMDACGNDAPLLWMLHRRGYDLHSLRRKETEVEKQNRMLREEVAALRRVLTSGEKQ